jgi:hypothetical protein
VLSIGRIVFSEDFLLSNFAYIYILCKAQRSVSNFGKLQSLKIGWNRFFLRTYLTNWALRHEDVWRGGGCIGPYFLDLGTSSRWRVSFTPRPLYPREKSPRYQLNRRLGGSQSWFERHREVKIFETTGTPTPTPRSSSHQLVLYRLRYTGSIVLIMALKIWEFPITCWVCPKRSTVVEYATLVSQFVVSVYAFLFSCWVMHWSRNSSRYTPAKHF